MLGCYIVYKDQGYSLRVISYRRANHSWRGGVSAKRKAMCSEGYRSPSTTASTATAALRISSTSSGDSCIDSAPIFSLIFCLFPGDVISRCGHATSSDTHGNLGCARNGDDVIALSEQPRKGDLACSSTVLLPHSGEGITELQDLREVLRVARYAPTPVVRREVIDAFLDCCRK